MQLRNWLFALAALALPAALQAAAPAEVTDWTGRDPAAEKSAGALVYRETCAACHDAGVGRAPQRLVVQDMTPDAIHNALITGAMRAQGTALSAEQKVAVAEYLTGRKLGAAMQPPISKCAAAPVPASILLSRQRWPAGASMPPAATRSRLKSPG